MKNKLYVLGVMSLFQIIAGSRKLRNKKTRKEYNSVKDEILLTL